jgi:hypothetical protein
VEAAKKTLAELKEVINQTKEKQKVAAADCKRLEKEMADFKNNKDSKLNEIKASASHLEVNQLLMGYRPTSPTRRRTSARRRLRSRLGRKRYKRLRLSFVSGMDEILYLKG